jgi:hypothetical protein
LANDVIVTDAVNHDRVIISIEFKADGTYTRLFRVRYFQNFLVGIVITIVGMILKVVEIDLLLGSCICHNLIAIHGEY